MAKDDLAPILAAAKGLMYPSESEAPFDAVGWPGGQKLEEAVGTVAGDRPVRETTLEEFFAELGASDEGAKWKKLREAIEQGLDQVRVFRVGERKVDVYIVGRPRGSGGWLSRRTRGGLGPWEGLHTTSVET